MLTTQRVLTGIYRWSGPQVFSLFLAIHLCAQWLGSQFYFEPEGVATLWPASGLLVAALIVGQFRYCKTIVAAVLVSGFISDYLIHERGFSLYIFFTTAELVEGLIGAWFVQRSVKFNFNIQNFKHVTNLLLIAGFCATMLGACIGASALVWTFENTRFWTAWHIWWFADLLGIVVVTPFLLALVDYLKRNRKRPQRQETLELIALLSLFCAIQYFVFGADPASNHRFFNLPYIVFPLVIWATLRFHPVVPTLLTVTIAFYATWQTNEGMGPFIRQASDNYSLVLVIQGYIAVLAILSPLLSATVRTASRNEALLKSFLENSPNIMTIKDSNGRYTHISDELCRLFKLTPEQAIGHTPDEVFDPQISARIVQGDLYIANTNKVWRNQTTVETPEGDKTFLSVKFPVKDADGNSIAVGNVATDITDIKDQQLELQEKEQRQRTILEAVGSGGWDYDLTTGNIEVSESLMQLIGYQQSEIEQNASWTEKHVHPEDLPRMRAALKAHLTGIAKFYECELRIRHKSGEYIWLLMRGSAVSRDDAGRVTRIIGANFDIRNRKQAEAALIESEYLFRDLVEGSIQGICIHNAEQVLFANSSFAEIFGYSDVDRVLAVESSLSFYAEYELDRLVKFEKEILDGIKPSATYEFDGLQQDGTTIHLSATARQISWRGQNACQIVVVDITEQRRASQKVARSEERYRNLFDLAPVALYERDWSKAKKILDDLHEQGVSDISQHLKENPGLFLNRSDLGDVLGANQELLKLYGAKSYDLFIEWIQQTPIQEHNGSLIDRIVNLYAGNRRDSRETIILRINGEEFPVLITTEIVNHDINDWSRIYTSILDLTDQKQAEVELQHSEARYRRLFETAPVALWEQDWSKLKKLVDELRDNGVKDICEQLRQLPELSQRRSNLTALIDVNTETLRLWGSNDKESFIKSLSDTHRKEITDGLLERVNQFLNGERRVVTRYQGLRSDGSMFPIRNTTQIVGDDPEDWSLIYSADQDISEEVESAKNLAEYQDKLRSLAGQISLAEENERRRIASDLHDGTVQNLVLAKMHMANLKESLRTKKSNMLANSVTTLLESSLKETRTMIFEISPPVLYELGLAPAIEWLCEQFKQRTGITVDFDHDGFLANLGQELKIVVFQTVRELLVNVAKHAQANAVKITWREKQHNLVVSVEDDGIGIDLSSTDSRQTTEGGYGLFSVRERLSLLGANIWIESSKKGTRITITAPTLDIDKTET